MIINFTGESDTVYAQFTTMYKYIGEGYSVVSICLGGGEKGGEAFVTFSL